MVSGQARFIGKDFISYCSSFPWEDVFIQTDREKYIAGENIWFGAYVFDRQKMKPSILSSIVYVELLNYDNRPVLQRRVFIRDGFGSGQFSLPDTLSSGSYNIRAYTAWMKNYMPGGCFSKDISIYNAVNINSSFKKPVKHDVVSDPIILKNQGLELKTTERGNASIELKFIASGEYREANGDVCNLFIHTRGNINISETVSLSGEVTTRIINKKMLLPGINSIDVFDAHGRHITEKLVFTPSPDRPAIIRGINSEFVKRQNISVDLDVSDNRKYENLSVSITPFTGENNLNLENFLVFGNEFGPDILKVFAGKDLSKLSPGAIDSMLTGVKSNWINWDMVSGRSVFTIKYLPEISEHFISGKLVNAPGRGNYVLMSIPGKDASFQYAVTNNNNEFSFGIPIDDSLKEIIIQPDDEGIINLNSGFSEEYSSSGSIQDTSSVPRYIWDWSSNLQVQKIYGVVCAENSGSQYDVSKQLRFYGKPDIELILADYIKLPVMEEVFFELLPGTFLKKRKTGYEIYVIDPVTRLPYDYPTSLFIDGIRIDDAGQIAEIDPETVERIDVVKERYFIGDYLFHGIVNVITKKGDFSAAALPANAVRTYYRVIDPVLHFISPEYGDAGKEASRIPDFRNTLLWMPSLKNKSSFDFWSSDVQGNYIIKINGIASDGSPVSDEKLIMIK
ncbi:MAG TPA: hypothetical protein VHO46_14880 [Bacteroidales bacterium]|nr:hypothetical protein [Bacteroidales bacterium]